MKTSVEFCQAAPRVSVRHLVTFEANQAFDMWNKSPLRSPTLHVYASDTQTDTLPSDDLSMNHRVNEQVQS